jgi:AcrR family transcriptional regulator
VRTLYMEKSARSYNSTLRENKKELSKQALLNSALDLFYDKGRAATQINEITKNAGKSMGSFYVHFKDKEDLVDNLLNNFNAGYLDRFSDQFEMGIPSNRDDLLNGLAHAFLDYWKENEKFVVVYIEKVRGAKGLKDLSEGFSPELIDALCSTLEDQAKALGKTIKNGKLIIHGIFGMWMRVGLQYLFNESVNKEDAIDSLVRLTRGALEEFLPTNT